MHAKPIHNRGTGLIQADDLNRCTLPAELDDDLIQSTHGGDIPEVGATQVNHHPIKRFPEIKARSKLVRRTEKHLAHHLVATLFAIGAQHAADMQVMTNLVGEKHCRQQHADKHAIGQVMGRHHH